jgi:hypothetical protein
MVNATDPTLSPVGHVTPWSVQLAYVFVVYATVAVSCLVWFFVSRCQRVRRVARDAGISDEDEREALIPVDMLSDKGGGGGGPSSGDQLVAHRGHGPASTLRFLKGGFG